MTKRVAIHMYMYMYMKEVMQIAKCLASFPALQFSMYNVMLVHVHVA